MCDWYHLNLTYSRNEDAPTDVQGGQVMTHTWQVLNTQISYLEHVPVHNM